MQHMSSQQPGDDTHKVMEYTKHAFYRAHRKMLKGENWINMITVELLFLLFMNSRKRGDKDFLLPALEAAEVPPPSSSTRL